MRTKLAIAFLIITKDRNSELFICLNSIFEAISNYQSNDRFEIIILNNGGKIESNQLIYEYLCSLNKSKNIQKKEIILNLIYSDYNKGVAEGRNILFCNTKADILIFIDDDAEILNKENFIQIIKQIYDNDRRVGIIAVKSVDPKGEIIIKEIPRLCCVKNKHIAFSYVGVCHIIFKRCVENESFLYPKNLFYGMEEFYLSIKTINKGFDILYSPKLRVMHHKSRASRLSDEQYYITLASNKIYIAYLLQNKFIYYSYFFFWSLWLLYKIKRVDSIFGLIKRLSRLKKNTNRDYFIKLNHNFFRYIKCFKRNLIY